MRAASLTHRVETLRAGESGHREKFAFSTGHPVRLSQREQATDGPGAFFEMGEEGGDLNRKCWLRRALHSRKKASSKPLEQ